MRAHLLRPLISMSTPSKILEGVLAINKPPSITSAQVLRDLQTHFDPSSLFAPYLIRERLARSSESHNQSNRRSRAKRGPVKVKIGHGGTLDPLATGVLIAGLGKGTKELQRFLLCTKSYEAVVLFGAASDTYDTEGKVVARAEYEHITKKKVEEALERFRGKIMQKPPIYSALRIDGKRLYEYAREGKELPREIEERPVEVVELRIVEWMEGGAHGYEWPEREAEREEKDIAEKLLHLGGKNGVTIEGARETAPELKRKHEHVDGHGDVGEAVREVEPESKKQRPEPADAEESLIPGALQPPSNATSAIPSSILTGPTINTTTLPCPAPAARLLMTVTSGFYVRSLCHDLGAAVNSLGLMASLVRTRQGEFKLGENVLEYEDLKKGEEVWGPQVERMLDYWNETAGDREGTEKVQERVKVESVKNRRNSSSDEA